MTTDLGPDPVAELESLRRMQGEHEKTRKELCDLLVEFDAAAEKYDEVARKAADYKNSWENAKAQADVFRAERDKARHQVAPLREEVSKLSKALREKELAILDLIGQGHEAKRRAAAADSRVEAFQTTFERMQRARDAAQLGRECAERELAELKAEVDALWKKAREMAETHQVVVDLLTDIRSVMPADLAQVKNEAFRKLLAKAEGLGIKPKSPAKAG